MIYIKKEKVKIEGKESRVWAEFCMLLREFIKEYGKEYTEKMIKECFKIVEEDCKKDNLTKLLKDLKNNSKIYLLNLL